MASFLRLDVDSSWAVSLSYFIGGSIWGAFFVLAPYFPNGQPYPPRLAKFISGLSIYLIAMNIVTAFTTDIVFLSPLPEAQRYANPFYLPWLDWISIVRQSIGFPFTLLSLLIGVYSLWRRYRDGDARTRLQVRWLAWNFALFFALALIGYALNLFSGESTLTLIYTLVFFIWLGLFPIVVIGIAILRHRLYDIDIIIRRTLIYTVLTGILAFVYFGGIIVTQQLFQLATGEVPDFAIVLSTLLIAALFAPLRRRVQDTIDRRLYRRKYDVEQTLADFQKNLREDVDMETLKANLIGVVSDTMQPTSVRLWIAPSAIGNNTPNSSSP
jgi:uncharacterized membrane protein YozB (DUF420 family)